MRVPAILALLFFELFGVELLQCQSGFNGPLQLLELCRSRLIHIVDFAHVSRDKGTQLIALLGIAQVLESRITLSFACMLFTG
jgi:hypothetical protein